MNYKLKTIPSFDNELKHLSKKYPSLKKEYADLLDLLEINPVAGISLGRDCYKIRLAIKSKGRGKSGGGRVITCVKLIKSTVYLISIYEKGELDNLSDAALKEKLQEIK